MIRDRVGFGDILSPDSGGESVHCGIRSLNHLINVFKLDSVFLPGRLKALDLTSLSSILPLIQ